MRSAEVTHSSLTFRTQGGRIVTSSRKASKVQIKGKRKSSEQELKYSAPELCKQDCVPLPRTSPSPLPYCLGYCFDCKSSLASGAIVACSRGDCNRVFHRACVDLLDNCSWHQNGELTCPQHVCYACGYSRGARLWRCQHCPIAAHVNCIPRPELTTLYHNKPGWAICWRHAASWNTEFQLKPPSRDLQEIFRRLLLANEQQDFSLTSEFIKEVMENDKEPPPYFLIRRNVFLIKKRRDDADDGVGCTCGSTGDECGDDCECRVQSMSCSKDCNCSDKCCNKPFRKDKRLKIVKTEHCGWGAVAAECIKKENFVIEYTGEVIDDAMCEKRLWEMKGRRSICNFYMCEIAKDFIIDATRKGNASRYLNHSCQPNCKLEKWRVDGETRVGVFAARDIIVGEELTYDYNFLVRLSTNFHAQLRSTYHMNMNTHFRKQKLMGYCGSLSLSCMMRYVEFGPNVKCCCGAPNCRGAIGERFNSNRAKSITSLSIKWGFQQKRSALAAPSLRLSMNVRKKKQQSDLGS